MEHHTPFQLACPEQIQARVTELSRRSTDTKSRVGPVLKALWHPERDLKVIRDMEMFGGLRQRFPNFTDVIDILEANAIGLGSLELPFECSPLLLQGEPGLGKTLFVSEFARLAGLPFFEISMATTTAGFALSGGDLQWAEGGVGLIAKSLAHSQYANPIILIDEIDKAMVDSRYSPISVFYTLLEAHTAKRFKDEALQIELDASRIIWIATANYLKRIPEPILSRMRTVAVETPQPAQMLSIISSLYSHYRQSKAYGHLLADTLTQDVIQQLATMLPRDARKAIEEAGLKTIAKRQHSITVSDLPQRKQEVHHVGFY